jgi:hypothetical protein
MMLLESMTRAELIAEIARLSDLLGVTDDEAEYAALLARYSAAIALRGPA